MSEPRYSVDQVMQAAVKRLVDQPPTQKERALEARQARKVMDMGRERHGKSPNWQRNEDI